MLITCFHHHHHHHHQCHHHHHHHHHHHQFFLCPHNKLHRRHVCPNFPALPAAPNGVVFVAAAETSDHAQNADSAPQLSKEKESEEIEEEEFEDEDEPVFVLTDEWRDFFAKSEAKRKLEKKLAKKGKKN